MSRKCSIKIILLVLFSFSIIFEINSEEIKKEEIEVSIVNTFKRSLKHWDINYESLKSGKAGAACIPWDTLDSKFLNEGIFIALGYSWQIETERVSMKAALEGCERMRKYHKVNKDCFCEPILFNEELRLNLPKDFQINQ